MHGDDIDYAFGVPLKEPERFTEEERQLSVHMMRLFTDFAKTGSFENSINMSYQQLA